MYELQHFEDDKSDGFSGMAALIQNPDKQYELELRAYEKEINFAKEQGKNDIVEDLIKLREKEKSMEKKTIYSFDGLNSKQRSGMIYQISQNMNEELETFLLSEFEEDRNLKGKAFGFVTVSWIIALVILEKGSNSSIIDLKKLMHKYWSEIELEDFKSYISNSPQINSKF